ncbi:hypothetical protein [Desulfoluna spongiiphila]|uniref:hypothetical protein n=1 Tax=Desulfoluna spongiiphila TaxID=419481 RepID=UPI000B81B7D5|nr:hypothetical protein [Desulfoluna spongiiphila]
MISFFRRARIDNIRTELFNKILQDLIDDGWSYKNKYKQFNAWIDYGKLVLKKGNIRLVFEWDNWTDGVIFGKQAELQQLSHKYKLETPTPVIF